MPVMNFNKGAKKAYRVRVTMVYEEEVIVWAEGPEIAEDTAYEALANGEIELDDFNNLKSVDLSSSIIPVREIPEGMQVINQGPPIDDEY